MSFQGVSVYQDVGVAISSLTDSCRTVSLVINADHARIYSFDYFISCYEPIARFTPTPPHYLHASSVQGAGESQHLRVRRHFLFNLQFEDCWKGSERPRRASSHAASTDDGSHMFFLAVSA